MNSHDKTEWATFFNGHAPEYEENCFTKNTLAEVDFLIEELGIAPGHTVLDVGCGTGRHAIELARRGYRVTGLDVSSCMLEQARSHADSAGVEVVWMEANAQSFTVDVPFDAVIGLCEGGLGLLGSSDDPIGQPLAILRNVAHGLKPAGRCMFTVLNGYAMSRRMTQEDVKKGIFDPVHAPYRAFRDRL